MQDALNPLTFVTTKPIVTPQESRKAMHQKQKSVVFVCLKWENSLKKKAEKWQLKDQCIYRGLVDTLNTDSVYVSPLSLLFADW